MEDEARRAPPAYRTKMDTALQRYRIDFDRLVANLVRACMHARLMWLTCVCQRALKSGMTADKSDLIGGGYQSSAGLTVCHHRACMHLCSRCDQKAGDDQRQRVLESQKVLERTNQRIDNTSRLADENGVDVMACKMRCHAI